MAVRSVAIRLVCPFGSKGFFAFAARQASDSRIGLSNGVFGRAIARVSPLRQRKAGPGWHPGRSRRMPPAGARGNGADRATGSKTTPAHRAGCE